MISIAPSTYANVLQDDCVLHTASEAHSGRV